MDFSLNTNVALPQQQVSPQSNTPAANAGAVPTLQSTPDNVVTATVSPSETNVRGDDAFRRQGGGAGGGLAALEDLQIQGISTRVGFDAENDQVFLEILQPRTEEVIRRIPSESLVQFLNDSFDSARSQASAISQSGVDTSA